MRASDRWTWLMVALTVAAIVGMVVLLMLTVSPPGTEGEGEGEHAQASVPLDRSVSMGYEVLGPETGRVQGARRAPLQGRGS
jgi:hypothetical protein